MTKKRVWEVGSGVAVYPFDTHKIRSKHARKLNREHIDTRNSFIIDYRTKYYDRLLNVEDEADFLELIEDVLEEEFDEYGKFWIGGKFVWKTRKDNLFNCRVLLIDYDGERATPVSRSKKYHFFKKFEP